MVLVEGSAQTERVAAEVRRVDSDFFTVMGLPLLRGRAFAATDRDSMPPVAIVSQAFARQYIGGAEPLGARIKRGTNPSATVVGVVPDVMDSGVGVIVGPTLYLPYAQNASGDVAFVVRSDLPPAAIDRAMREALKAIDPLQPLDDVVPLTRRLTESLGESRFKTLLLSMLSLLAVVIASVGIYGVTAYLVAERTKEVAVRIALGAEPATIVRSFTIDSGRWVAMGATVGLALAYVLTRLLAARVPEIAAAGPVTYFVTALLLIGVGAIATVVPTIRASRMAPARVLRGD
jgi:putative ABC transport system permease protein